MACELADVLIAQTMCLYTVGCAQVLSLALQMIQLDRRDVEPDSLQAVFEPVQPFGGCSASL